MKNIVRPGLAAEFGPLAIVLIWGLNFVVVKAVLQVMDPHAMNFLRLIVSCGVLGILHVRIQRRRSETVFGPLRTDPYRIIAVGLLGYLLYQVAFIVGINWTTAGSGALIMASGPLWTAVLARLLGYETLQRLALVGLAISIVGTVIVVASGQSEIVLGGDALKGNLVMVLASLLWGSYTALSRPLVGKVHPVGLTFFAVFFSLPFLGAIAVPSLSVITWSAVPAAAWWGILASGALSTGIATALWNHSVRTLGASHTAAFQNAVPVVAVLAGAILLGEPILPGQIAGGVLIIGGLLIMRRVRRTFPVTAPR